MTPEEFVQKYEDMVRLQIGLLWRKFPYLTKEDVEDMAQECRIRLWRLGVDLESGKRKKHEGMEHMGSYIKMLIQNAALSWLRKYKVGSSENPYRIPDRALVDPDELWEAKRKHTHMNEECPNNPLDDLFACRPVDWTGVELEQVRSRLDERGQEIFDLLCQGYGRQQTVDMFKEPGRSRPGTSVSWHLERIYFLLLDFGWKPRRKRTTKRIEKKPRGYFSEKRSPVIKPVIALLRERPHTALELIQRLGGNEGSIRACLSLGVRNNRFVIEEQPDSDSLYSLKETSVPTPEIQPHSPGEDSEGCRPIPMEEREGAPAATATEEEETNALSVGTQKADS